jgi:hypothetical protein
VHQQLDGDADLAACPLFQQRQRLGELLQDLPWQRRAGLLAIGFFGGIAHAQREVVGQSCHRGARPG